MKRFFSVTAVVMLLVVLVMGSCEKQEMQENKSAENTDVLSGISQINVTKGILNFKTENDFKKTYKILETQYEQTMNNEAYEKTASSQFSKNYSYYSLMDEYLKEEEEWLNHSELDYEKDPDDKYIADDVYRTLLNSDGEIIINNVIYKFVKDNVVYKIKDLDWKSLEKIENAPCRFADYQNLENVIILNWNPDSKGTCKDNYYEKGWVNYQTDRQVKWKASVINVPFSCCVKAKTVSLKSKNGRWVRYNTSVKAKVYDFEVYRKAFNNSCSNQTNPESITGDIVSKNNNDKVECIIRIGQPFYVHDNTVKTYFYCNGWSKTLTLDF